MALLPDSAYRYSYLVAAFAALCLWFFTGSMFFGFSFIQEMGPSQYMGFLGPILIACAGSVRATDIRRLLLFIGICAFFVAAAPVLFLMLIGG